MLNKLGGERQILYALSYKKNCIHSYRKKTSVASGGVKSGENV